MLKVFLDANVFFAGFSSVEGASALVLKLAVREKWLVCASRLVLREAERNLRLKSKPVCLKAFRRYLQKTKVHLCPTPPEKQQALFQELIHPKDLPVLSAAVILKTDYLLTLDRRHFFSAALHAKVKSPKIMLPGDFIRQVYLKGRY
ncbi:MAG: hypothetical protein A2Y02_02590 [Omnitrophica bacterium GWA2_52_12]|nr:MAG: hypothetical protein A2Y02_02590 [Omnitrophica bacterium GWA2_52_12]